MQLLATAEGQAETTATTVGNTTGSAENAGSHSPCVACNQRCCRDYTVTVLGYDAWLIAVRLQLSMEQFLIYYPVSGTDCDSFRLDHSEKRFNIALAKRQGEQDGERWCVFWLPLQDGYSRCGNYSQRPFVCQTYPAFLSDGIVQMRTDALCPAGGWNLAAMDLPHWRQRLLRFQMEYDIYCCIVDEWNGHIAASSSDLSYSVNLYYAYLMDVYARLEQVRQTFSEQEKKAVLQKWSQCVQDRTNPLKHNVENSGSEVDPIWREFLSSLRGTIAIFHSRHEQR